MTLHSFTFTCENMKNITVSIDDKTYRHTRIVAAQRDTSVSAMVRDFLSHVGEVSSDEQSQEKTWDQVWETIDACNAKIGERPSRNRTYDGRRVS